MDIGDNPFECGFDKYVNLESDIIFLGKESLKKIKKEGIKRKLMGVKINTDYIDISRTIEMTDNSKKVIGELRSAAFSPKFKKIVGIAMIKKEFCKELQKFKIMINEKPLDGEICNLPIK